MLVITGVAPFLKTDAVAPVKLLDGDPSQTSAGVTTYAQRTGSESLSTANTTDERILHRIVSRVLHRAPGPLIQHGRFHKLSSIQLGNVSHDADFNLRFGPRRLFVARGRAAG